MDYSFNIENFNKIISSEVVPDDADGLDLSFGEVEISIKKPYVDMLGDKSGNSIIINDNDGLVINTRVTDDYLFVHYRSGDNSDFKQMYQGSPKEIVDFFNLCWKKIIDEVEKLASEKNLPYGEKIRSEYNVTFRKHQIPETLEKLIDFEEEYGPETYSESFYLCTGENRIPDRGQYSLDEEYFERLIEFANADGTGGKYAFWVNDVNKTLEEAPIIVIGSEGHIQVVAKNIKELIYILSFDAEGMDGSFYKDYTDDDYEGSENIDEFREWMEDELGIQPVEEMEVESSDEVDEIVNNAVDEFGEPFKKWMMSLKPQYESFDKYE